MSVAAAHPPPRSRWRHPAVWAWIALMALGLWLCARASYVADLSAFLPSAPTPEQRVLMTQLKNGATARVLMIGIRGGEPAQRAQASRQLAQALRASGAFESVHNGQPAPGASDAMGLTLFEHRYLLSPAVDAQRFTVEGLRAGIADTVSLLGTPAGTLIKPLLWRDPTGEVVRVAEAMLPASAPRMENGVWVSRNEPRAVLLATTRADGADLDAQAQAQALVRQHFAALEDSGAQGLSLELSGPGVFAVDSRATIESEVQRLALLGGTAMLVLLLVAFGSLKPLGIATLPVASGVVAGIAAVSLVAGQVHGLTLGFGTTLIGEAVDYGIYYLVQARALGRRRWLREHWPTVRLGLWTSIAGFAALAFSGFAGLAQLGLFAISGLAAAALTTRFLLPVLAPAGSAGLGLRATLGRATGRVAQALPHWRLPLLALTLAGVVVLVWQPSPWRGTLASLSPMDPQALALDASLRQDLGAADAAVLVAVEAADEAAALQAAEAVGERLEPLVQAGRLPAYQSPAHILPSPRTQLARQGALPPANVLNQRLAEAAAGGPLPAARLAAFVQDVQEQRQHRPLTRADLQGTPLAGALDAQLVAGAGAAPWTALVTLQLPSTDASALMRELRQALHGLPQARVVQVQPELDAIYADYLRQALWQALLGGLAVIGLLAWHLRAGRTAPISVQPESVEGPASPSTGSGRTDGVGAPKQQELVSLHQSGFLGAFFSLLTPRLLRVLSPLAASIVLVLAGLTLAGVELGVLHLIGLLLVAAIGSNYALFFDHLQMRGDADSDTLASLLMANLTTVVSFALLSTAQVPPLAAVGQTVAPGALLSLLLSAAFLRSPAGQLRPTPVGQ